LEEDYRRVLSEAVAQKISDPRLSGKFITITRVEVNTDFTIASVFFTVYNDEHINKIIKGFYAAEYFLLNILRRKIRIKYLPSMRFFYDRQTKEADRVTRLIDDLSAEYNLKHRGNSSD